MNIFLRKYKPDEFCRQFRDNFHYKHWRDTLLKWIILLKEQDMKLALTSQRQRVKAVTHLLNWTTTTIVKSVFS